MERTAASRLLAARQLLALPRAGPSWPGAKVVATSRELPAGPAASWLPAGAESLQPTLHTVTVTQSQSHSHSHTVTQSHSHSHTVTQSSQS